MSNHYDMQGKLYRLKVGVAPRFWNGKHPVEDNLIVGFWAAGTVVKVVMCSRFGDVGITSNLWADNGYETRVNPEDLEECQTHFSEGNGWVAA